MIKLGEGVNFTQQWDMRGHFVYHRSKTNTKSVKQSESQYKTKQVHWFKNKTESLGVKNV